MFNVFLLIPYFLIHQPSIDVTDLSFGILFKGEFTFLQSEEAQYKPILDNILAGLKKK